MQFYEMFMEYEMKNDINIPELMQKQHFEFLDTEFRIYVFNAIDKIY